MRIPTIADSRSHRCEQRSDSPKTNGLNFRPECGPALVERREVGERNGAAHSGIATDRYARDDTGWTSWRFRSDVGGRKVSELQQLKDFIRGPLKRRDQS